MEGPIEMKTKFLIPGLALLVFGVFVVSLAVIGTCLILWGAIGDVSTGSHTKRRECQNCGASIEGGKKFCAECGKTTG